MTERIAVLGLGYVGLPVAVALATKFTDVIGYDISERRVQSLRAGHDWTGEVDDQELKASELRISNKTEDLADRTFFIVTVPTPIDAENRPDLGPIESSCRVIGSHLRKGAIVVFESTVYPGVTEEVCGPILAELSGLKQGVDFFLGYSPERINPGDKTHRLETITKVVAADCEASLARVEAVYGAIINAGLHVAPTIKVAEAAKVIENTQRDLNIALMNEIALIFDRMGIRTKDVLSAASTKWNFLPFKPGLVGGHCIGVDPYYLTTAAERAGYRPEVILAGRRVNDEMGSLIARKLVKLLAHNDCGIRSAKVGILGLTFKENVPDLRNSKVPDIVSELQDYGIAPLVHDPLADPEEANHEYGLTLTDLDHFAEMDALILAVDHSEYRREGVKIIDRLRDGGVLIDVKSVLEPQIGAGRVRYWSL